MTRAFVAGLLLFAFCRTFAAEGAALVIAGATVIHPEREAASAVESDQTLVIVDDRIRAVGRSGSVAVPEGARAIDARGKWVIPALTDAHVHFDQSGSLYARPDIADLTFWQPYATEQARNRSRIEITLRAWAASGVTALIDVGGPHWTFELRQRAKQLPWAPTIAAAGPLVSMVARPQLDLGDPPIVQVKSSDEVRKVVQDTLRYRPDFIKVWFIHQPGDDLAQQEAIVRAAGEAAHAAGVRLAVHATELAVAKAALRAGADYLVHSVEDAPIDEEFVRLARARDVAYCPTLFVHEGYALALSNRWQPTPAEQRLADPQVLTMMRDLDIIPREKLPAWMRRAIEQSWGGRGSDHAYANVRRVWDAGIAMVMGTDAGNIGTLHGPAVFREMARMVQAGLTPLEVLRAATINGARLMRRDAGAIAPGDVADLVVLDADPLQDIVNTSRTRWVVKAGRAFEVDALRAQMEEGR
ncbi:MAG TPA: amidohydrolase family protein [Burkholderiales bacterium]|nr:amidohydrolase family protein [Burkholderiales bacterium]